MKKYGNPTGCSQDLATLRLPARVLINSCGAVREVVLNIQVMVSIYTDVHLFLIWRKYLL